jgi:UDP-N-acetylglucosamine 2-epimerase (non-hydrolysing)
MRERLSGAKGVSLLEPCGHVEMIRRMRGAKLILSDSGGMQEEAPALGVPLFVLRDKTERPEGLASGNMRLVGTSAEAIVRESVALLDDVEAHAAMSRRAYPYGDGQAATRIAAIIEDWLTRRLAGTADEPTKAPALQGRW